MVLVLLCRHLQQQAFVLVTDGLQRAGAPVPPSPHLDKGKESASAATDVEEGRSLGVLVGYDAPYTQDRPPAHGIAHAPHLPPADQTLLSNTEGG